jgi:predicted phage terminase large subunit-like protein
MRIAVVSHSQGLAHDLALKTWRLMKSDLYQAIFPHTVISDDRRVVDDFETTEKGNRYAASFETAITGRGFDLIIVDDPISAHAARSAVERDNVNHNFDTMLASRLDNPTQGRIVIVGQRLHEDDLSGHLLAKGGWTHVCLPLIAEEKTTLPIGSRLWVREQGSFLIPEMWNKDVLDSTRASIGEANFSAQYQQNPSAAVGELIRPDQIGLFDELPDGVRRRTLSWDTAVKAGPNSSYTVCLVIANDGRRHYVEDVLRARLDPVEMRDAALRLIEAYRPQTILVEDASSGPGLAKMLDERHHRCELRSTAGLSKEERLEQRLHMFAERRVLVKRGQPWTTEFVNELLRFPLGRHDDQVDALSQYLTWFAESRATPLILMGTDTKEERLAQRGALGRPLRKGEHAMRPGRAGPRGVGMRSRRW